MAAEKQHLQEARHNESLARHLAEDMTYRDWVITTAFYAALHYVEANFAKRFGLHGEDQDRQSPHIWRLEILSDKSRYSTACRLAYGRLYAASKQIRYLEDRTPMGAYFDDAGVKRFLDEDLAVVKKELRYTSPTLKT
jgi:hypothetical protein